MARFLVVDDDHLTVECMAQLLAGDGHAVVPFTAGAEAVEALSRGSFDAVMTDLEMPHVDGYAVLQVARERLPEACLVVVSAKAGEHKTTLTAAGACIVVGKPLDFDELMKTITECRASGGLGAHGRCCTGSKAHALRPASGAPSADALVKDSIEIVLRRLAALRPSREVEVLRAKAQEKLREADGWKVSPPTSGEREKLMRRVLALHVAEAGLEREPPER